MRIAVLGGGPGGLFAATLAKAADPGREVTVFERNRAEDTFGFGVVFSDATLEGIHQADPVLRTALDRARRALGPDRSAAARRAVPVPRQRDGGRGAPDVALPAPAARSRCRRRRALLHRSRPRRAAAGGLRPGRRRRRRQLAAARAVRGRLPAQGPRAIRASSAPSWPAPSAGFLAPLSGSTPATRIPRPAGSPPSPTRPRPHLTPLTWPCSACPRPCPHRPWPTPAAPGHRRRPVGPRRRPHHGQGCPHRGQGGPLMTRRTITPIAEGVTPWPEELARAYTERGWWRGRALGAELLAAADASPRRGRAGRWRHQAHVPLAGGPRRRARQPARGRARPGPRGPHRRPAAQLLAVRRSHPGLPAGGDRAGHGPPGPPQAGADLPGGAQRGGGDRGAVDVARLRPRAAGRRAASRVTDPRARPGGRRPGAPRAG